MALTYGCIFELVVHRDLLSELNSRINVSFVLPQEIHLTLQELAYQQDREHLPLPVACNSYIEHQCLVFSMFVGSDVGPLGSPEGRHTLTEILDIYFKMFFSDILQDSDLLPLLQLCCVRQGADCLRLALQQL